MFDVTFEISKNLLEVILIPFMATLKMLFKWKIKYCMAKCLIM